MAMAEENTLKVCLKRFPRDVREELDKIVQRSSWQALTKEFSVDLFTGLEAEALDSIPNLVDKSYELCQEDVKARLKILKNMKAGTNQSHKGMNSVGFHSYFYRFWLLSQRRLDGLYDIVFAHIARKEEFDFFLSLTKVMKGMGYAAASVPLIMRDLGDRLSNRAYECVLRGMFGGDEDKISSLPAPTSDPADETRASPYTDLSQNLGERLTDYELVEDLIERGMLAENEDGTLYIQLK